MKLQAVVEQLGKGKRPRGAQNTPAALLDAGTPQDPTDRPAQYGLDKGAFQVFGGIKNPILLVWRIEAVLRAAPGSRSKEDRSPIERMHAHKTVAGRKRDGTQTGHKTRGNHDYASPSIPR